MLLKKGRVVAPGGGGGGAEDDEELVNASAIERKTPVASLLRDTPTSLF